MIVERKRDFFLRQSVNRVDYKLGIHRDPYVFSLGYRFYGFLYVSYFRSGGNLYFIAADIENDQAVFIPSYENCSPLDTGF